MCYTIGIEALLFHKNLTDMFFKKLEDYGFIYSSFEGKNQIFIKVFMDSDDSKNKMSDLISEFVYVNYVKDYFMNALDECYYYFDKNDKDEMFDMLCYDKEKLIIKKEILNYLSKNNTLYLKGFVKFRLKPYFESIYEKSQYIADEYLDEKEYLDFIKLLKYFVSVQNTSCEKADIIKRNDGRYLILDENKKEIDISDCEFSVEIVDNELEICDVLLSEIISLAPQKLVFHRNEKFKSFEEDEVLKMLERVFENKIEYCTGCNLCKKYKEENLCIKNDDKIDSDFFKKV
ncbi:MAG: hypothetical protein E7404_08950 [Ruminococcaceae bacterium]|nr:hypothetical protein [Oscillospiraceae bacterium]